MVAGYSNKNMNYKEPFVAKTAPTPPTIKPQPPYYAGYEQFIFKNNQNTYQDVFDRTKIIPKKKNDIPLILKIVGTVVGGTTLILFHKNIWKGLKKYFKNITK